MKIMILQQDLLPILSAVSRSVGVRSTLPVLANILLETEAGKLKVSATNLEVGVVKRAAAEISEEGAISVPAKTILDVVASLSPAKLTLESLSDQLKISSPNFKASLNGMAATEFPAIPLSSEKSILVDSSILKLAIPQISFAAAADEGRPVLTGVLTEIKDNLLELVATDGFRLAHQKVKTESSGEFKAIVPRRTFEEIVRLIGEDSSEKIQLSSSENQNQLIFKVSQTELSSRLIEGQFPAWEKIIPRNFETRVIMDRVELLKAVKLSSVFAKDAANITKVHTQIGKIILTSQTKELGEQENELEAQSEGKVMEVAFNSKFLIDILTVCPGLQVSLEFSGNLSAALIKPVGETGLEYIIMPVRVN